MMEAEADVEGKKVQEAKQGVHIVEEVASALEEEGFLKVETSTQSSPPTVVTTVTGVNTTKPAPSLTTAARVHPDSSSTAPSGQEIRQESSRSQPSGTSAEATWQSPATRLPSESPTEGSGGGVWGWVSSAVSASLQTTQNLGRNLVEKTKV